MFRRHHFSFHVFDICHDLLDALRNFAKLSLQSIHSFLLLFCTIVNKKAEVKALAQQKNEGTHQQPSFPIPQNSSWHPGKSIDPWGKKFRQGS
jgi:hypothetical protein